METWLEGGPLAHAHKCDHSFILLDKFDNRNVSEAEVDIFGDTILCQKCLLTLKRKQVADLNKSYKESFK